MQQIVHLEFLPPAWFRTAAKKKKEEEEAMARVPLKCDLWSKFALSLIKKNRILSSQRVRRCWGGSCYVSGHKGAAVLTWELLIGCRGRASRQRVQQPRPEDGFSGFWSNHVIMWWFLRIWVLGKNTLARAFGKSLCGETWSLPSPSSSSFS